MSMAETDSSTRSRFEHTIVRVDERMKTLLDVFYARLFAAHPDIKPLFGHQSREKQKEMLLRMLSAVIDLTDTTGWIHKDLAELGARHTEYEVCSHMYPLAVDALVGALAEVLADDWTASDAAEWRASLDEVAVRMMRGSGIAKDPAHAPPIAAAVPQDHTVAPSDSRREEFENADLLSLDLHTEDPWDFYAWLRDEEPLFWDRNNEMWAVSRYDDIMWVSRRTDLFCSGQGVIPKLGLDIWPDDAMINKDGDEHTCRRALVSKALTPRRVEELEPRIREIIDGLINNFIARGSADLVKEFSRPLPFRVIADMLGYPEDIVGDVLDWTDIYCGGGNGPAGVTEEVVDAFANFHGFHESIIEERRACPGKDLVSALLAAEVDGQKLTDDMLLWEHNLLLVGGSETTRSAIAIGMQGLMAHPDQLAYLVANVDNDDVLNAAVEEMIRYSCPFVRMRRTATQDVEFHGKTIRAGEEIVLLYPSANRDPRAFHEPDVFDVRRDPEKPALSFGIGKHYCPGASLARLDTRLALEALLRRLPDIHMKADAPPVRLRSCFVRSLTSLPVEFSAK